MGVRTMPPVPIGVIPTFPIGSRNSDFHVPPVNQMQKGDFIVSRYASSRWAGYLPWEGWHHAALISEIEPLTIIEAIGPNSGDQQEGPTEVLLQESVGFGKSKDILAMKWLRPVFPDPIREVDVQEVPRSERMIITKTEARNKAVKYARKQLNEEYSLLSTKWSENRWYCSLLIYKSYSRTVTGLYLEDYDDFRAGIYVTPEDIIDSPRSEEYFSWDYSSYINA